MKKYMEYCEIVCPPRSNTIDPNRLSIIPELERPYVVLGTDERGEFKYLLNDEKKVWRFPSVLDAANLLSKRGGWHLSKTYVGAKSFGTEGFEYWVMAREVRIED